MEPKSRPFLVHVCVLLIALVAGATAWTVRSVQTVGIRYDVTTEGGEVTESWGSYDPDTLYHVRRVARGVADGGWIAAQDPLLSYDADPERRSSAETSIPWPPTYDLLLTGMVRGALPDPAALRHRKEGTFAPAPNAAERARIERIVATVPLWCASLAAALVALVCAGAARRAFGAGVWGACTAAAVSGLTVALTFGHVRYSHLGNGDHHAFVSLLHVVLLGLVTRGLARDAIDRPVWSAVRGALSGVVAAILITSWTASILWVVLIQVALFVRLFRREHDGEGTPLRARGLPLFATSFHKAVLLGLLPAVLHSPYTYSDPWSLVELSWFHAVLMAVGWLVFAPYALAPKLVRGRRLGTLVAPVLLLALVVFATPVRSSLAEALSWAGAENSFMASITESQPLLWGPSGSLSSYGKVAGYGAFLAPALAAWLIWRARSRADLLALAITLPVVLALALAQRRFVESLAPVLALALGLGAAAIVVRLRDRPALQRGACLIVVLAAVAAHPAQIRNARAYAQLASDAGQTFPMATRATQHQALLANVLSSLRQEDGADAQRLDRAVLAHWDLGHVIEWRAGAPTVATNFGQYVGEDSFLEPWRVLAATDMGEAETRLRSRGVRYVLLDGDRNRAAMARALATPIDRDPDLWRQTLGARLLRDGRGREPLPVPPFLRLVRLAGAESTPTVRVYEVVRGARLAATGTQLSCVVTLRGANGEGAERVVETWRSTVRSAQPGRVEELELRVPFASGAEEVPEDLNGFALQAYAQVLVDGVAVPFVIDPKAVADGLTVFARD